MKALARNYWRDVLGIFDSSARTPLDPLTEGDICGPFSETPTKLSRTSPRVALFFLVVWALFAMIVGAIVVPLIFALIATEVSHL